MATLASSGVEDPFVQRTRALVSRYFNIGILSVIGGRDGKIWKFMV